MHTISMPVDGAHILLNGALQYDLKQEGILSENYMK